MADSLGPMLSSLVYLYCLLVAVVLGVDDVCDVRQLESVTQGLKYDSQSLSQCQQIILQLQNCQAEDARVQRLLNQLYYRAGIIQLSLSQDMKAIDSFEQVVSNKKNDESFCQLAKNRLDKLYIEFGLWDKVDSNQPLKERFQQLNASVFPGWEAKREWSIIDNELHEMLEISPYSFSTRTLYGDVLSWRLSGDMDISTAHEIIKNYEVLSDKYMTKLTLDKRLALHHSIAVIQLFIINTEPTHLRKCLAVDMDYEPCRRLTLLNTKLNKINPSRSQVLDPETYSFGDANSKAMIDWDKIIRFYLKDKKPCSRLPSEFKFENNYKLIMHIASESIEQMLNGGFVKSAKYTSKHAITDFHKFIDTILCQAAVESATNKETAAPFCKKAMKEILTTEESRTFEEFVNKGQSVPEELLTKVWNSYPHLAYYSIQTILEKGKRIPITVQDQLYKFYHDHKLYNSENKYIRNQLNMINSMVQERRQKQQQEQKRQQQQWFFNQNQNQHQQHQQRPPPQPNSPKTDIDYYKILDIPKTASTKEIRGAYLDFTKKYHPDKQGQLSEEEENKIHEKMSTINEAYETLSNEEKRKEYDIARSRPAGGQPRPNMFRHDGQNQRGNPFQYGNNFKVNYGFRG